MGQSLVGQTIGSYQVTQLLGKGGMGAVYLAEHPSIGRRVAVKVLLADAAERPGIVERFFAEAKAVNLIRHPNIVDVTDLARLPDGRCYLVMEYLDGPSLSRYLAEKGTLSLHEAAGLTLQMAGALGAAHAVGIVHRDLKPDNVILLPRPGELPFVKLLDFGIAKLTTLGGEGSSGVTRTGAVMGTPAYMSPEQAMGKNKEIDARTDVYALGVLLFQMLTGHVPFDAEAYGEIMIKHVYEAVPKISAVRPELPGELDAFLFKVMAKRKEDRHPNMQQLAHELVCVCTLAGTPATMPTLATPHSLGPIAVPPPPFLEPLPMQPSDGLHGVPTASLPPSPSPTTLGNGNGEVASPSRRRVALLAAIFASGLAIGGLVAAVRAKGGRAKPTAIIQPAAPRAMAVKLIHLTVTSSPPGASVTVTLDGKASTSLVTPAILDASAGSAIRLTFSLAGYHDATESINPFGDDTLNEILKRSPIAAPHATSASLTRRGGPLADAQEARSVRSRAPGPAAARPVTIKPTPSPSPPKLSEKPADMDF